MCPSLGWSHPEVLPAPASSLSWVGTRILWWDVQLSQVTRLVPRATTQTNSRELVDKRGSDTRVMWQNCLFTL